MADPITLVTGAKSALHALEAAERLADRFRENSNLVAELRKSLSEAQKGVLAAQAELGEAKKEIESLVAELADQRKQDDIRSNYRTVQTRWGAIVKEFVPIEGSSEPAHWACPKCFGETGVYALQPTEESKSRLACPSCGFTAQFREPTKVKPRVIGGLGGRNLKF